GKDEIIMSQFRNGDPWVKVYRYNSSRTVVGVWMAYDAGHNFGATVAAGDVDYDGKAEVVTGAGPQGDPHVRVFESDGTYKGDIYAFPAYGLGFNKQDSRQGIDVSVADVDGDFKPEIGASVLGNAQSWAKVFKWNEHNNIVTELKAYEPKWVGANMSMGDLDGDNVSELVFGAGFKGGPHVKSFETNKHQRVWPDFFAYDKNFRGGTDVEVGYTDRF
ncbi:FG-GAP repeat protein, partial [Patescibacteria group bacterium]|nr:FG-GAP repeat protein [Patescibacteria group bacterium]